MAIGQRVCSDVMRALGHVVGAVVAIAITLLTRLLAVAFSPTPATFDTCGVYTLPLFGS